MAGDVGGDLGELVAACRALDGLPSPLPEQRVLGFFGDFPLERIFR